MGKSIPITQVIFEFPDPDNLDALPPEQRAEFESRVHDVYSTLLDKARERMAKEKELGIKRTYPSRKDTLLHCHELANALGVELPKAVDRLSRVGILAVEGDLEFDYHVKERLEKDGVEIVYDPPRLPLLKRIDLRIRKYQYRSKTTPCPKPGSRNRLPH